MKEFFTLDDFEFEGKTVAVRIDLNSKFDKKGNLKANERFYAYSKTIKELIDKNAKIIVLAHQSRKGEKDFVGLERHSTIFSSILKKKVKFVDELIGEKAKKEIQNLKEGEVLMLDNVRFLDDETLNKTIEEHSNSSLVKFLSQFVDYYVLDAFSVSHRSHASIVGFATVKPMIAGRVMEKEINEVKKVMKPLGINGWIIGGSKIDDCINVIEFLFKEKPESIERILTGGLLANLFLISKGYEIGSGSIEVLRSKGYLELVERAKKILDKYEKEIVLPEDVAFEKNGERKEENIDLIPRDATVLDIGSKTISKYKEIIDDFRTIVVKGPLGLFEKPGFELGTKEILEKVSDANAVTLIGGGDTGIAVEKFRIEKTKFSYISVGGGALITYLSGKKMPGIEALKISYNKFKK